MRTIYRWHFLVALFFSCPKKMTVEENGRFGQLKHLVALAVAQFGCLYKSLNNRKIE